MTEKHPKLTQEEVVALRGIRLPAVARKQLQAAGIYCEPAISIEHQRISKQYVLRGTESGGCAADIGEYCAYVAVDGTSLPWLQRAQSVGVNGVHAIVVAPAFARLQMFHTQGVCELLITRHELEGKNNRPPLLSNRILFHARNGVWNPNAQHLPQFMTRAGEPLPLPERFCEAILRTSSGLGCSPCRHVHVLVEPIAKKVLEASNSYD